MFFPALPNASAGSPAAASPWRTAAAALGIGAFLVAGPVAAQSGSNAPSAPETPEQPTAPGSQTAQSSGQGSGSSGNSGSGSGATGSTPDYSDSQLDQFAEVFLDLRVESQSWQEEMQSASNEQEQEQIRQEAYDAMVEMVRQSDLGVETYREIAEAARNSDSLRREINERVQAELEERQQQGSSSSSNSSNAGASGGNASTGG
jgi:signal recognition particle GTPase